MEMTTLSGILAVCMAVFALGALAKPIRLLGKLLVRAAAGAVLLWVGQSLGASVGVNGLTLLVSGLLGIPGAAGLCLLSFLL